MRLRPTWFARIPTLLASLRAETAPLELDRRDLQDLFGVRRRRAIYLLHRCGAVRRGSELVAARGSVIEFLEQRWSEEAAGEAVAQQRQVAETLAQARRALTLPRISLPPAAPLSAVTFAGLPPGIALSPGALSVQFSSAQDLVEKLFTLAQAFANDYESLEAALTEDNSPPGKGGGLCV